MNDKEEEIENISSNDELSSSDQPIAVPGQALTENNKPQTENMEVHHHTHSESSTSVKPGKKFKHYLFEFFMLFLAVFCGFLAENIREHNIEKHREKEFIASLISDLKDDTLIISSHIEEMKKNILLFDTLSYLLESLDSAKKYGSLIYYTSRLGIRQAPLANNSRTFDQLKNSGGFRLIRKQEAAVRIMDYYSLFPELRMMEGIFNTENTAFKAIASQIMDHAIYQKQVNDDGSIKRIPGDLALLTYNPSYLRQLGFYAVEMNGSRQGMIPLLKKMKLSAEKLIVYLKQGYHLK